MKYEIDKMIVARDVVTGYWFDHWAATPRKAARLMLRAARREHPYMRKLKLVQLVALNEEIRRAERRIGI
jgi:hypothetical protein